MFSHHLARLTHVAVVAVVAATLAGCRSPQPQFYTLLRPSPRTPGPTTAPFQIEVVAVDVPAQVDVPQMVVRTGAGELLPVDTRRWIAPLASEIRTGLSNELTRELGTIDNYGLTQLSAIPTYRVALNVKRFDSLLDQSAQIEAVWTVRVAGNSSTSLLCSSRVVEPASSGFDALAQAHQRAIGIIARQIAAGIRAMRSGAAATCPESR